MKTIITLSLILTVPIFTSGLQLSSVKQVTWLQNSDEDPGMYIRDVPFVTAHAEPEWFFSAISTPFVPATDGSWKKPSDVNLASLYGIVVAGTYKKASKDVEVTIDLTKAKVPEGYPFSVNQVTEQVKKCVKLMYPYDTKVNSKLEIKVLKAKN